MKKIGFIFGIFLSVLVSSCASTTYYIVRHGEKTTTPPKDPLLSEQGMERAQKLKEMLKGKDIKKIYSTNYQRTKMTVQPFAEASGIAVETYNPSAQGPFIEQLKTQKENTLIVGHSNTLKPIVNGLAEKEVLAKDLDESEYDHFYVIKRAKSGKIKVIASKY